MVGMSKVVFGVASMPDGQQLGGRSKYWAGRDLTISLSGFTAVHQAIIDGGSRLKSLSTTSVTFTGIAGSDTAYEANYAVFGEA